jgi:OOP family OmpA-OmpF porin
LVFKGVFFNHDEYEISSEGLTEIKEFARVLNQREIKKLRVEGHTDSVGSNTYNMSLSKNRADNVLLELKKLLDDKSIIFESVGKSDSVPIDNSDTAEAKAKNRRVEILIDQ